MYTYMCMCSYTSSTYIHTHSVMCTCAYIHTCVYMCMYIAIASYAYYT